MPLAALVHAPRPAAHLARPVRRQALPRSDAPHDSRRARSSIPTSCWRALTSTAAPDGDDRHGTVSVVTLAHASRSRQDRAGRARATLPSPIPTRVVSNGEYLPAPQTRGSARVEHVLAALADRYGAALGMDRRQFLRTSCGMAAAFLAMNQVFGSLFDVGDGRGRRPAAARARARRRATGFVSTSSSTSSATTSPGPASSRSASTPSAGTRRCATKASRCTATSSRTS